jgi:hypothetical protein
MKGDIKRLKTFILQESPSAYGRPTRFVQNQRNDDHFRREVYIGVIDRINQELEGRFNEVNMELLSCMTAFDPSNSLAAFDAHKRAQTI